MLTVLVNLWCAFANAAQVSNIYIVTLLRQIMTQTFTTGVIKNSSVFNHAMHHQYRNALMARLAYMHQMQFMIMIYIEKNGLKAHKKLPAEKRTLSLGISGYLSMARMVQMYDISFG